MSIVFEQQREEEVRDLVHEVWRLNSRPDLEDDCVEYAYSRYDTIPVYLCQTPKGIYGFNLSLLSEPEWFIKGMPKTSHFSRREFVDKEVGMLHINHAKLYK